MSLTLKSTRDRVDALVIIGGLMVLIDTLWGGILALGLDLSRTNELVLAVSFVIGLPIYLLDIWVDKRVAIFVVGFFLFRWAAVCFAGPVPVLCSPWRGNALLMAALVLLQASKLRRLRR